MAKLCPRGKAAAKRKFKVYPSAYANMYASAVCSGKVTPGGKKKAKKAMGGSVMSRQMYGKGGFVARAIISSIVVNCSRVKGIQYRKSFVFILTVFGTLLNLRV